jgi:hypothetical protein
LQSSPENPAYRLTRHPKRIDKQKARRRFLGDGLWFELTFICRHDSEVLESAAQRVRDGWLSVRPIIQAKPRKRQDSSDLGISLLGFHSGRPGQLLSHEKENLLVLFISPTQERAEFV